MKREFCLWYVWLQGGDEPKNRSSHHLQGDSGMNTTIGVHMTQSACGKRGRHEPPQPWAVSTELGSCALSIGG